MPSWIAVFRLGCRVEIMDWRGDKLSTENPRQPSDRQGKCCEVASTIPPPCCKNAWVRSLIFTVKAGEGQPGESTHGTPSRIMIVCSNVRRCRIFLSMVARPVFPLSTPSEEVAVSARVSQRLERAFFR